MAEFADMESVDGVRMTWNVWPNSKIEASKCVVPLATVYTPIRPVPDLPVLPYSPLRCKSCLCILNPYSRVDYTAKIWICPFCYQRNHFPQHYAMINENNVPAELFPQYTTIEYALSGERGLPPVFLFVLDTCVIEEELGYLKSALSQAITLLPEHALVGLITFGTQVHVHELGFADLFKTYVFRGSKEVSKEQILDQLGLTGSRPGFPKGGPIGGIQGVPNGVTAGGINRFLLAASDCEYTLNSLLDELQRDQWPVQANNRAMRCTGMALSVAAGLLGACVPGTGARILALVGGPCTEGPGTIVSKDLSEPVRSHKDLDKDAAPHYHKAVKFYEGLAKQLVSQGHVLDLFASALDQLDLMKCYGWLAIQHGRPTSNFPRNEDGLCSSGTFEVNCSKDVKIQGIIGPCTSLEKKGPSCADNIIGQGNTTSWKMCGLDKNTSLTVFFDIAPSERSSSALQTTNQQLFIQFQTHYQHTDGQMRLRITTVTRRWADGGANTEARFLLAKLNPSATYNSANEAPPGGDIIFTDDVSLQVFVEHLQRLAVQS